jgi:hypothetical protein
MSMLVRGWCRDGSARASEEGTEWKNSEVECPQAVGDYYYYY